MKPHQWWLPEAQQTAFRAVLDGFARPGTLVPAQGDGADAVLMFLSAVLDESVSLADPLALLGADHRRLLLAPTAPADQARFVVLDGRQPPADRWQPALGSLESPELGATLVLTVAALSAPRPARPAVPRGDLSSPAEPDLLKSDAAATSSDAVVDLRLQGPGIPGSRLLSVTGLDRGWLAQRAAWVGAFPLGVDLVLAAPHALVALPRTTRIAIEPVKETI
jgi:alpha-D-ribose 1-methylphosphonate 5-triphosphate synthase subunit PhnH